MNYREQEQEFDRLEAAIDSVVKSERAAIIGTLDKLATGYEVAGERERRRDPHLSTVYVIRAQGIREALKAIEE